MNPISSPITLLLILSLLGQSVAPIIARADSEANPGNSVSLIFQIKRKWGIIQSSYDHYIRFTSVRGIDQVQVEDCHTAVNNPDQCTALGTFTHRELSERFQTWLQAAVPGISRQALDSFAALSAGAGGALALQFTFVAVLCGAVAAVLAGAGLIVAIGGPIYNWIKSRVASHSLQKVAGDEAPSEVGISYDLNLLALYLK